MSVWQPSAQGLADLLQLLREAINPTTDGQHVQQRLEYFNNIPDYNSYLVYILTQMPQEDPYVRSVAGLTLKNNIRSYLPNIDPQVIDYVKTCCIQCIGDEKVGKPVGLVIAAIVSIASIQNWPQILQVLLEKLDDPNPIAVENAFSTFQKICEDSSNDLDIELNGIQPLEYMIPKFIEFFGHPDPKIRLNAITCTFHFIIPKTPALMNRMDAFLSGLFTRAIDDNLDVRTIVCQSLVSLLEVCPEVLFPHMPDLVRYMIFCTRSEDPDLALEACEFWLVFAEQDELRDQLRPYLPTVVPVLLKGMVYSEMDLMAMGGDEDDAHIEDDEQDIKPRFHKSNEEKKKEEEYDDDEEEDEDDDYDYEDDDMYGDWNLRKCSAATLDVLCTSFQTEVIHILIPLLKGELESSDWLHRECGILALGAAAEGGMREIAPHLTVLVPYLLRNLTDSKPLVRSITCWTLGRYCDWIVSTARSNQQARHQYLEPLVQLLLQRILDNNKRVQEAACSSFSLLEEAASVDLIPYLQPILRTLSGALTKFQKRNLLLLYDTLGTLADVLGENLNTPQFIELIIPPLLKKFQQVDEESTEIFPLLECLASVTTSLGKGFLPFAELVFNKTIIIICKILEECRLAAVNPDLEEPDKDILVVSFDLLSSIIQALKTNAEPLIRNSNPPLVQLLAICIGDEFAELNQSSYALVGDIAFANFEHISPALPQFMPLLIEQINPQAEKLLVCNNAIWAVGEIAIQWHSHMANYAQPLLQRLLALMGTPQLQRTLLENTAITLGRLGLVCPTIVAPHLEMFVQPWLQIVAPLAENEEKASAFSGLCEMIKVNPQGAVKSFPALCNAIVNYHHPTPALNHSFGNILMGYKNMYGEAQWQKGLESMPNEIKIPLKRRYNI